MKLEMLDIQNQETTILKQTSQENAFTKLAIPVRSNSEAISVPKPTIQAADILVTRPVNLLITDFAVNAFEPTVAALDANFIKLQTLPINLQPD